MKDSNIAEMANKLKNDPDALASYLINAAKNVPGAVQYKDVYESYLFSDHWHLKKAAIFSLLFVFKLKEKKYIDRAIEFVNDSNEDEDVRSWSISSLSAVYEGSKEILLLKLFYNLITDDSQDSPIRIRILALQGIMHLLGLPALEIYNRGKSVSSATGDDFDIMGNLKEFKNELEEARNLLARG